jgi:N-acetylglutamate synthase-like GNAT family acetyltransferase
MILHFQRATAEDFNDLSDLCLKVKKNWGYSNDLIDLQRDELTITPRFIRNNETIKIENDLGEIVAFGAIKKSKNSKYFEIIHFWIMPELQNHVTARLLLNKLEEKINPKGVIKMLADPNIVEFFKSNGYLKVGEHNIPQHGTAFTIMKKVI